MKKYLEMASIIVTLLAGLGELIKSVNTGDNDAAGNGAAKKTLVMQMLEGMFSILAMKSDKVDVAWTDISGLMDKTIDAIVGFFQAIGKFKKA